MAGAFVRTRPHADVIIWKHFAVKINAYTIYGVADLGFAKTSGQTLVERENDASRLASSR